MKHRMGIMAVVILTIACVMGIAGCASGGGSSSSSSATSSSSSSATSSSSSVTPMAGMANPWSDAASAKEAAEGAGVGTFEIPVGATISLGAIEKVQYTYMKGVAEAYCMFPAVDMYIRKGLDSAAAEPGDISGDYNTYKNTWTQDVKGLVVTCFGNRQGDATKTIWSANGYDYCILARGMGGDTDYGLSADDLNTLINGIQ